VCVYIWVVFFCPDYALIHLFHSPLDHFFLAMADLCCVVIMLVILLVINLMIVIDSRLVHQLLCSPHDVKQRQSYICVVSYACVVS